MFFDRNHHNKNVFHSSVRPLAGRSIGGVHKLDRQVTSKRQLSKEPEKKFEGEADIYVMWGTGCQKY